MRRAILAAILCLCPAVSFGRIWTDCTGLHTVEGEIARVSDKLYLKLPTGKEISVELDKLCEKDVAYLKDWRKTHKTLGEPPEALKSDAEKGADKINALVKKINDQIDAVASEDTATRRSVAYAKIIRDLDTEIKNNVYELQFPITDVKDDAEHTLTLTDPEGIDDQVWHLAWFGPKYPTDKAVKIHAGDAFLIRGRGRLIYNYDANSVAHASLPKATCVVEFHNAVSKQYYALYLQDFSFHVEHVISVDVPIVKKLEPPNNATVSSAAPQDNGTASSSVGGNPVVTPMALPVIPAVVPQATPPVVSPSPPPQQVVVNNPPQSIFGPAPTTPNAAPIQNPPSTGSPPVGSGVPQPPYGHLCVPHYNFNIDTPAANKVRASLTPERQDQRYARLRKVYDDFDRYRRMPSIEVGANYRYEFWWYFDTWDAARKARWLYNLHDVMEWDLYVHQKDMPGIAEELQKLERENKPRDPYYVDAHFEDDPDLMYVDEFVDAIYQKEFTMNASWATDWGFLCGICVVGGIILIAWARYSEWF